MVTYCMYYRAEKLKKSLSQQDTDYDEFDSFNEQDDHVDESNYYEVTMNRIQTKG